MGTTLTELGFKSKVDQDGIRLERIIRVLNPDTLDFDYMTQPLIDATDTDLYVKVDDLESLLTSIKDTDGIKKITDALPAGTNTIGAVDIAKVLGVISTVNSSITVLDPAGVNVFTGTAEDVSDYKSIGINVIASHASATDGLTFQFSSDGTNWDKVHSFTLAAATAKFFNIPVESQYFRVVYTNGAVLQTYFRLQVVYHATMTKESTLRLSEVIDGETAAQLSRAIMSGRAGANYINVTLDSATGRQVVMDSVHHEVHEGDAFTYSEVTDVANGATRDILIVTPNTTKWAHLVIAIETELEADFLFYEDTTTSADGTGVTEINRNRNSVTAATAVVTHTPTVTAVGTLLHHEHWGTNRAAGGGLRGTHEWILKQNAKYLIRLTNATALANQMSVVLDWYEHTNIG